MTDELRIPDPDESDLKAYAPEDLYHLAGELDRAQYLLSSVQMDVQKELDRREDG